MHVEKLKELMKNVTLNKCKGIMRSMQFKNKELSDFIIAKTKELNTKNCIQTIYWLINGIEKEPICERCKKKECKWYNYIDGYDKICGNCINVQKVRKTMKERYGVESPFQLKEVREKAGKYDRTGWKEKWEKTTIENFGSLEACFEQRKIKTEKTNLGKYGETHYLKTEEGKEKVKQSYRDKYGQDITSHMMLQEYKDLFRDKMITPVYLEYVKKLVENKGFELLSDYKNAGENITVKCKNCNHIFDIIWNYFQQNDSRYLCPKCKPNKSRSNTEIEICDFIKEQLKIEIVEGSRNIINPYEVDIYIPSLNKAIEYDGLRYHSTDGHNAPGKTKKDYHLMKLNMCNEKGIQLITIFEDEYLFRKDVVISKIKLYLNYNKDIIKLRAEKCIVKEIDFQTKHNFLNQYHLQGDKISSINIGIFNNEQLVSVMTFNKIIENTEYELCRYCCLPNYKIYGAAVRMMNYFKNNYQFKKLLSYADRRWSQGDIYYTLGFKFIKNTEPNYWYWNKDMIRKHRLNFSKGKLISMKNYNENLSEFEIMSLEGYSWIYDCGSMRFEINKGD